MQATSNNDHSSMFHVRLYACNIFLFTFVLLLVNMKVTNLISSFPVIDNPAITRVFFSFFLPFFFTNRNKQNYIGYLHREQLFFKKKYFNSFIFQLTSISLIFVKASDFFFSFFLQMILIVIFMSTLNKLIVTQKIDVVYLTKTKQYKKRLNNRLVNSTILEINSQSR